MKLILINTKEFTTDDAKLKACFLLTQSRIHNDKVNNIFKKGLIDKIMDGSIESEKDDLRNNIMSLTNFHCIENIKIDEAVKVQIDVILDSKS